MILTTESADKTLEKFLRGFFYDTAVILPVILPKWTLSQVFFRDFDNKFRTPT